MFSRVIVDRFIILAGELLVYSKRIMGNQIHVGADFRTTGQDIGLCQLAESKMVSSLLLHVGPVTHTQTQTHTDAHSQVLFTPCCELPEFIKQFFRKKFLEDTIQRDVFFTFSLFYMGSSVDMRCTTFFVFLLYLNVCSSKHKF